jgi:glycosyltransferase involved in cell wall biosynthesis
MVDQNQTLKYAVLHAFFKSDCKGGGEKLVFALRDHYHATLYAGAVDLPNWDLRKRPNDSFVQALWDKRFEFKWLHEDSTIPVWKKIKRQLAFAFSSKIKQLENFDVVFFSGNIALAQGRLKKPKKVLYCHTTPRPFTDQLEADLKNRNFLIKPFFRLFAKWVVWQYTQDCKKMDLIVSNSANIQKRLKTYTGLDSVIIYPTVDTNRFQWLSQGDYFVSYARLEEIKRIHLVVEAFAQMPDKKLVICSAGPLKEWILLKIQQRNLTNISFEGLVSDERLAELVGGALAGIYIPVNEDAGITQIEIMAAGKPVIGVDEGALPDTVIHNKTGLIIPADPTVDDLKKAIEELTPERALSMKEDCVLHAKTFDQSVFFQKMDAEIEKLFIPNSSQGFN